MEDTNDEVVLEVVGTLLRGVVIVDVTIAAVDEPRSVVADR